MSSLETFLTIIAWVFGVLSSLLLLLKVLTAAMYSEQERRLDACRGRKRVFPIMKPLVLAVICWAWILSR
jgi:hypothetical protein